MSKLGVTVAADLEANVGSHLRENKCRARQNKATLGSACVHKVPAARGRAARIGPALARVLAGAVCTEHFAAQVRYFAPPSSVGGALGCCLGVFFLGAGAVPDAHAATYVALVVTPAVSLEHGPQ